MLAAQDALSIAKKLMVWLDNFGTLSVCHEIKKRLKIAAVSFVCHTMQEIAASCCGPLPNIVPRSQAQTVKCSNIRSTTGNAPTPSFSSPPPTPLSSLPVQMLNQCSELLLVSQKELMQTQWSSVSPPSFCHCKQELLSRQATHSRLCILQAGSADHNNTSRTRTRRGRKPKGGA